MENSEFSAEGYAFDISSPLNEILATHRPFGIVSAFVAFFAKSPVCIDLSLDFFTVSRSSILLLSATKKINMVLKPEVAIAPLPKNVMERFRRIKHILHCRHWMIVLPTMMMTMMMKLSIFLSAEKL